MTEHNDKRQSLERRSSYMSFRQPPKKNQNQFILPPKQRQRWGDTQILPHVNWGDLFFDLFYVGAAYNLGNILKNSPSLEGLLYFCGCAGPVYLLWSDRMYYDARFAIDDDPFHRILEVIELCVLATAVLHIRDVDVMSNPSKYEDMFAFSLAIFLGSFLKILRSVEIALWCEGEPAARKSGWRDIQGKLLPTIFYLCATIVSGLEFYSDDDDDDEKYHSGDHHRWLAGAEKVEDTSNKYNSTSSYGSSSSSYGYEKEESDTTNIPILLCFAGYVCAMAFYVVLVIFCFPKDGLHKLVAVPMNIDFSIHRFGEFTMLMLGESILSLLIVDTSTGTDYYTAFYSGVLAVTLLQYLHFRSQPHSADGHALRRSKNAGITFSNVFQIYSASLVVVGASYKLLLTEYTYEEDGSDDYHRLLDTLSSSSSSPLLRDAHRLLAGGGAPKYDTEDRQQRIAHLFSISMALSWVCLDLMALAHKGLNSNLKRCWCGKSKKLKKAAALLVMIRVGLVVFMATLGLWVTRPKNLALIGLGGVVGQVAIRVMGDYIFHDQVHHSGDDHGHGDHGMEKIEEGDDDDDDDDEDNEDEKWPNRTYPRSKSTASKQDAPQSEEVFRMEAA